MSAIRDAALKARAEANARGKGKIMLSDVLDWAGFTGTHKAEAEGVAWAESGLNATAKSKNPDGGTNIGLFQIDDKAHSSYRSGMLTDPYYNARAAFQISKGGKDWSAWETWVNGDWKHKAGQDGEVHNADAKTRAKNLAGPNAVFDGGPAIPQPLKDVADVLHALVSQKLWFTLGKLLLGVVLMVGGFWMMAKQTQAGKSAAKVAKHAAVAAAV